MKPPLSLDSVDEESEIKFNKKQETSRKQKEASARLSTTHLIKNLRNGSVQNVNSENKGRIKNKFDTMSRKDYSVSTVMINLNQSVGKKKN